MPLRSSRPSATSLGRGILLGLELLVAADIIGTVAVTPSFQSLGVLALIVVIRTFLSFSLEVEIEGHWRGADAKRNETTPAPSGCSRRRGSLASPAARRHNLDPDLPTGLRMIRPLGILLTCQLAGEIAARILTLPVPGPVLGIVLLLVGLHALAGRAGLSPDTVEGTDLGRTAGGLLQSLGLLFVPAGVGVIDHLGLFTRHGLALLAALIGSTLITLIVTAVVFGAVGSWLEGRRRGRSGP